MSKSARHLLFLQAELLWFQVPGTFLLSGDVTIYVTGYVTGYIMAQGKKSVNNFGGIGDW
jgi:hypothetical protein